ncbi:MAG: metalloregulator ArsR/SmtB family transcription factor [Gemmatimonadales bacterium]
MRHLARRFKALSEESRLDILLLLFRYGELCGCEVERFLEMSQSKASRHLRYLRNAGLVEDRREGLWIYYRIAEPVDDAHERMIDLLRDLLARAPFPDIADQLVAMRAERCVDASDALEHAQAGDGAAEKAAAEVVR